MDFKTGEGMSPLSGILKKVDVYFADDVDSTYFNQSAYEGIQRNGLWLSDFSLIHYASIHYQSRFKNNIPRRVRATFDTIEPSVNILLNTGNNRFYFSGTEESELKKQSSEVIGVGFAIAVSHKLFDANLNRINRLDSVGNGKRCDYEIIKENQRLIVESKGGKYGLNKAKSIITAQKSGHPGVPKYGIISRILRNLEPVSLYIVDPEVTIDATDNNYIIFKILEHYSKVARLAGLYRLSEKINERLERIIYLYMDVYHFNNQAFDFGNVIKMGKSLHVGKGLYEFIAFFAPDQEIGLKHITKEGDLIFFGIDKKIFDIIVNQDFDALLSYNLLFDYSENGEDISALDNGTFLIKRPKNEIDDILSL